MRSFEVAINNRQDVSLTVYLQDVEKEFRNIIKRPSVLIIPGGGYQFCPRGGSGGTCLSKGRI